MKLNKQNTKMVRKNIWLLPIFILSTLFVIQLGFAAVTLNVPVAGGNYTTITFDCSAAIADISNCTSATIYYDASGGAATTSLGSIANTSANQQSFTSSAISIESLADGTSYNFTCQIANLSGVKNSSGIKPVTIDNTVPSVTATTNLNSISYHGLFDYTTAVSDATSGLSSSSCTITNPASSATTVSVAASSITFPTDMAGDYSLSCTATDLAGNTNTKTQTISAAKAGNAAGGAASGSSSSAGSFSIVDDVKNFAKQIPTAGWIVIGVIVVIFFANKK